jgi:hypothetical protein
MNVFVFSQLFSPDMATLRDRDMKPWYAWFSKEKMH